MRRNAGALAFEGGLAREVGRHLLVEVLERLDGPAVQVHAHHLAVAPCQRAGGRGQKMLKGHLHRVIYSRDTYPESYTQGTPTQSLTSDRCTAACTLRQNQGAVSAPPCARIRRCGWLMGGESGRRLQQGRQVSCCTLHLLPGGRWCGRRGRVGGAHRGTGRPLAPGRRAGPGVGSAVRRRVRKMGQ